MRGGHSFWETFGSKTLGGKRFGWQNLKGQTLSRNPVFLIKSLLIFNPFFARRATSGVWGGASETKVGKSEETEERLHAELKRKEFNGK